GWDEDAHVYSITEESKRFAAVLGSPDARDVSVMPYQEEPKDVPIRFVIETRPERTRKEYVPILIARATHARDEAQAAYARLLASVPALYAKTFAHYRRFLDQETVSVTTPDSRLDQSFAWAKVGVAKGMATNPLLGTGLVAGFRTSGDSERPGF